MVFVSHYDVLHVHHRCRPRGNLLRLGKSLCNLPSSIRAELSLSSSDSQPLSGSIYIWATEAAGPKYGRFVGTVVAWWTCTAWMTFAASNCQVGVNVYCRNRKSDVDLPRRPPITSCPSSPYGRSISPVAFRMIISSGARSFGGFRKCCWCSRLL